MSVGKLIIGDRWIVNSKKAPRPKSPSGITSCSKRAAGKWGTRCAHTNHFMRRQIIVTFKMVVCEERFVACGPRLTRGRGNVDAKRWADKEYADVRMRGDTRIRLQDYRIEFIRALAQHRRTRGQISILGPFSLETIILLRVMLGWRKAIKFIFHQ